VPPVAVVGCLNLLNWSLVPQEVGGLAATPPGEVFVHTFLQPLAFILLATASLPTAVVLILPGVLLGLPLCVLSLRRGWTGLGWFIAAGAGVGALTALLWLAILRQPTLPPFSLGLGDMAATCAAFGGLIGAIMWLHIGAPESVLRRPWLASLPLTAILPPTMLAMAALLLLRRPAALLPHLALTAAGMALLLAVAFGRSLLAPPVLLGLCPAALLLALLAAVVLNRLQRRSNDGASVAQPPPA
jgi:hypothetical protein